MDSLKSFSKMHLRISVDLDSGVERFASRAAAILGQSDVLAGGVSESDWGQYSHLR